MKSGVCPKCNSEEVYVHKAPGPHGLIIPIQTFAAQPSSLFICADCGYIEVYAETGFDLSKVKEKFTKVKS